jgi:hypothetical protein
MATKAIQSAGGDYATVALWEAYLESIGTLSEDEIGQIALEELTSSAGVTFQNIDPGVHRVVLEAQPNASFRDHANKLTNALRYDPDFGAAWLVNSSDPMLTISIANFTIRNLMLKKPSNYGRTIHYTDFTKTGNTIECCILHGEPINNSVITARNLTMLNSLIIDDGSDFGGYTATLDHVAGDSICQNCTFARTVGGTQRIGWGTYTGTSTFVNCAQFGYAFTDTGAEQGNNNGCDDNFGFGSSNVGGLTYADQFQDINTATMDFRLKSGSGLINNGTASGSPTPPTTDIIGQTRSGNPDIGCWEFQAAVTARQQTLGLLGCGA